MIERLKVEHMILCVDCKHYQAGESRQDDLCMADAEYDLVRGAWYSDSHCYSERDPRSKCRPQGLNFVPKNLPKPDVLTKRKKV